MVFVFFPVKPVRRYPPASRRWNMAVSSKTILKIDIRRLRQWEFLIGTNR
jgi:hypothetical protein